jgi:ABC-type Fe3+/spermidine/putrescine transport system ATPase subunit/aminoglycoside/choline kinase family phosphotransferase
VNAGHLHVADVSHSYDGEHSALRHVDLEIERGEFVTVVGPSGCGKTTLLRIIAGFVDPTSGRVLLDGRDLAGRPPNRRPTNLVLQRPTLFPHLTVAANIGFGLMVAKVPKRERARRVAEAVELLQLGRLESRRPFQLSGGQMQRVALARALVNEPDVLLLDEPLAALDMQVCLELEVELRTLHRETGTTFVYVTHDQRVALALGDRVVVFDHGEVAQVGRPEDVYRTPMSAYVARFVGSANVLSGEVVRGDDRNVALIAGHPVAITEQPVGRCSVVIRSEAFQLSEPGRGQVLDGLIVDRIYRGATVQYRVRLDHDADIVTAEVSAAERARKVGDRVGLRCAGDVVVLADGGRRGSRSQPDDDVLQAVLRTSLELPDDDTMAVRPQEPVGASTGFLGTLRSFDVDVIAGGAARRVRVVVKRPPKPGTAAHELTSRMGFHANEIRFYAELAPQLDSASIPRYFGGRVDDRDDGFLILEDLRPAAPHHVSVPLPEARTELALQFLATLHARFWRRSRLESATWPLPFARREAETFVTELYRDAWPSVSDVVTTELASWSSRPNGPALDAGEFGQLARAYAALGSGLGALLDVLAAPELPVTVVHGDFYGHNCLFGTGHGSHQSLHVIDFQNCSVGCGLVDVAFFLAVGLTAADRRHAELKWLARYHALLTNSHSVDYPFQSALAHYRPCRLWAVVQAIASTDIFAAQWDEHPELRGRIALLVLDAYRDGLLGDFAEGRLLGA